MTMLLYLFFDNKICVGQCWRSSKPTSISTVKSIVRKYRLLGRIAARKSFLNERYVHSRLNWCKAYSKANPSLWNDVIFSDECQLKLFGIRREYVRRPKGTRFMVFMADNWDIGCTTLVKHYIKTRGGPISIKPWRQPINLEDKIEETIKNLFKNGIIRKCNSSNWELRSDCLNIVDFAVKYLKVSIELFYWFIENKYWWRILLFFDQVDEAHINLANKS